MNRVVSIGGAELLLLWRNRLALFNALLTPPLFALLLGPQLAALRLDPAGNATLLAGLIGVALTVVVYYNLVSTYVARREELTLKRMRTGTANAAEIMAGTAGPAVAIALAQIALIVAAGAIVLDLPMPAHPPLLIAGVLGGIGMFTVLATASTIVTRTVEMAQITTMPMLLACFLGAGLIFPLDSLPGPVETGFRLLPLGPVIDLITLGWTGTEQLTDLVRPLLLLAGWVTAGTLITRRWFRWEPRR